MAPPARPLPDDLIPGILLRLAPDDPAGVVRSAAVCKSWRRVLADPTFSAHYRALHPTATMLGFVHNPHDELHISRLVPTSPFRPSPAADHHMRHAHDARHGRVLFYDYGGGPTSGFLVWDPISGDLRGGFRPSIGAWTQQAVLCAAAAAGCDHRSCGGGGHFIVAAVAMGFGEDDWNEGKSSTAQAEFYSSETGEWGMHVYTDVGTAFELADRPAAAVGDSVYFVGDNGILLRYRYDLLRRRLGREMGVFIRDSEYLSVIKPPEGRRLGNVFVVAAAAEDGGLGLASLYSNSTRLYLWGRETATGGGLAGDDGAGGRWVQRRVVDLKMMLPIRSPKRRPRLCGVAEDGRAVFVSTEDGVFAVGIGSSSLKARKVSEVGNVDLMYPFMSFYTEALLVKLASGKIAAPVEDH